MFINFLFAIFSVIMVLAAFDLIATINLFIAFGTTNVTRKEHDDCLKATLFGICGGAVLYGLVVIGFII